MTLAAIEYTDANQMLADYAARRRMFFAKPAIAPPAPPPAPEPIVVEPPPPLDPLAQYRLAYDSALDPKWDVQVAKRVLRETAAEHRFTVQDVIGESRRAALVRARQVAMWRIAKMTSLSMPHIAILMGGKDHTTVLHSIRRINEMRGENVRGVGNVWRGKRG